MPSSHVQRWFTVAFCLATRKWCFRRYVAWIVWQAVVHVFSVGNACVTTISLQKIAQSTVSCCDLQLSNHWLLCVVLVNCPSECNFNGICEINGTCVCYEGYIGSDCSNQIIVSGNARSYPRIATLVMIMLLCTLFVRYWIFYSWLIHQSSIGSSFYPKCNLFWLGLLSCVIAITFCYKHQQLRVL